MKASVALAFAAMLLAAPVFADEPARPPAPTGRHDDFAARKDAYLKQVDREMAAIGKRLGEYSEKTKEKGTHARRDVDKDLLQAWNQTKEASRDVAAATRTGWDEAKAAFERASRRLKQEWREHDAR